MPTSAIFPIRMNRHCPWTPWKLGALFRSDVWGLVDYCALGLVILWRRHWCLLLSLYGILCTANSCLFASFLHLLFSLRFSYVCGCSVMTFVLYLRVGHAMLLTHSCMKCNWPCLSIVESWSVILLPVLVQALPSGFVGSWCVVMPIVSLCLLCLVCCDA